MWLKMHPVCEFPLQWFSRSGPLMRMVEPWHASRLCVYSPVLEQIRSTDENYWTCIQQVSSLSVFEQIRSTDENGWTCRKWVHSPVFEEIRTTDNSGTCIQEVSLLYWADLNHWWGGLNTHSASESLQCLSRSEPLMRMAKHTSREWVHFLVFEQIRTLMRMAEYASSKWVYSPVLTSVDQSRTTDKNGWIHI